MICACGCNQEFVRKPRKDRPNLFIHGHHRRGVSLSDDVKQKIGSNNEGKIRTLETKQILSRSKMEKYATGEVIPFWQGKKRDPAVIEKLHNGNRGKHNWRCGNGRTSYKGSNGYIYVQVDHAVRGVTYVMEHRFVMGKHVGRKLTRQEVVHHIDFNKTNNHINNLLLLPNIAAHNKLHAILRKYQKSRTSSDLY